MQLKCHLTLVSRRIKCDLGDKLMNLQWNALSPYYCCCIIVFTLYCFGKSYLFIHRNCTLSLLFCNVWQLSVVLRDSYLDKTFNGLNEGKMTNNFKRYKKKNALLKKLCEMLEDCDVWNPFHVLPNIFACLCLSESWTETELWKKLDCSSNQHVCWLNLKVFVSACVQSLVPSNWWNETVIMGKYLPTSHSLLQIPQNVELCVLEASSNTFPNVPRCFPVFSTCLGAGNCQIHFPYFSGHSRPEQEPPSNKRFSSQPLVLP